MEEKKTISKVIPDGELNCIWAEAGLVSYKLCDRNYECDECPFDMVMRQKSSPASASSGAAKRAPVVQGNPDGQGTLSDLIRNLLEAPFEDLPPSDRYYSRGHVWVKKGAANCLRIGIDHYAAGLLEGVTGIVLPQPGSSVVRDNPCAWMLCEGEAVAINSPLNGKIRSVNPQLVESLSPLRTDPYGYGWLTEISSDEEIQRDRIDADAAESFARGQFREFEFRLTAEADSVNASAVGVTLMDGGKRLHCLKDVVGTEKFVSFLQKLLLTK